MLADRIAPLFPCLSHPPMTFSTLVNLLQVSADQEPNQIAYTFLVVHLCENRCIKRPLLQNFERDVNIDVCAGTRKPPISYYRGDRKLE